MLSMVVIFIWVIQPNRLVLLELASKNPNFRGACAFEVLKIIMGPHASAMPQKHDLTLAIKVT